MKLVRFGAPGCERPGVWLDDTPTPGQASILDVRRLAFDLEDYNAFFFAHGGPDRLAGLLRESAIPLVPAAGVRLGPPIAAPSQIICLGKNYAAHAAEFDGQAPTVPIFFGKATSAVIGPYDPIVLPAGAHRVDGEVELAAVIGRAAHRVTAADALRHVAGYTILNDITDRDLQRAAGQWFLAKSADSFCPLGPFMVTPDEIPDPHTLEMSLDVNATRLQQASTAAMLFKLPELISRLSAVLTLQPGDVLSTGTPEGIGSAHRPPVLLRPGDVMTAAIARLGAQRNAVCQAP